MIMVADVIKATALHFGLKRDVLISDDRTMAVVRARQVGIYVAVKLTGRSKNYIGDKFGRDHSTVVHACKKIGRDMATDHELKSHVNEVKTNAGMIEAGRLIALRKVA